MAFGHSHAHIRHALGVTQDDITAAIDRMDAAVADDPPFMLAGAG